MVCLARIPAILIGSLYAKREAMLAWRGKPQIRAGSEMGLPFSSEYPYILYRSLNSKVSISAVHFWESQTLSLAIVGYNGTAREPDEDCRRKRKAILVKRHIQYAGAS